MMSSIKPLKMGNYESTMASWETSLAIKTQERDNLNTRLNICLSMVNSKKILIAALHARVDILNKDICNLHKLIEINKGHPW